MIFTLKYCKAEMVAIVPAVFLYGPNKLQQEGMAALM